MTVRDKDTLRGLFESGDQPTGDDFADLIDSYLSVSPGSTQQEVQTCVAFADIKSDEIILRDGTTEHGRIRYSSSAAATVIEGWNGTEWVETIRSGNDGTVGFFGDVGAARPTITGASGCITALGDTLTALDSLGILTDSSTNLGITTEELTETSTRFFSRGVATVAALTALDVTSIQNGTNVVVRGYSSSGDGGGGLFFYDSSSTLTADGGTIFAPDTGSGRWLRVYQGAVNPKWFGAKFNVSIKTVTVATSAATATVNTSGLATGMVMFIPGAGASGVSLRRVITSVGSGNVTFASAVQTGVVSASTYYGTIDTTAIQAALEVAKDSAGICEMPRGTSLIETALNITDSAGSSTTLRGFSKNYTALLANTGGVGIDLSGASGVLLENFRLYTVTQLDNPAKVGVLKARCSARTICAYNALDRVQVELLTDVSANGNAGTIGLYNYGGEFSDCNNVTIKADRPVVYANTNLYSIASPHQEVIASGTSMTQMTIGGGSELSSRSTLPCITISNASNISLDQAYLTKADDTGDPGPAIDIVGKLSGGEFNVNVEKYTKVLRTDTAAVARLVLRGNAPVAQDVSWVDVNGDVRGSEFLLYTSGHPIEVTHSYFSFGESGNLEACRATLWHGQDSGFTAATGIGCSLRHEKFAPVRVRMNTATSFSEISSQSGTTTRVVFDQGVWDKEALCSAGVVTAPVTGFYRVNGRYQINLATAAPTAELAVFAASAAECRTEGYYAAGINTLNVGGMVFVSAGNTIELRVRQDSGLATLTTGDFDTNAAELLVELI